MVIEALTKSGTHKTEAAKQGATPLSDPKPASLEEMDAVMAGTNSCYCAEQPALADILPKVSHPLIRPDGECISFLAKEIFGEILAIGSIASEELLAEAIIGALKRIQESEELSADEAKMLLAQVVQYFPEVSDVGNMMKVFAPAVGTIAELCDPDDQRALLSELFEKVEINFNLVGLGLMLHAPLAKVSKFADPEILNAFADAMIYVLENHVNRQVTYVGVERFTKMAFEFGMPEKGLEIFKQIVPLMAKDYVCDSYKIQIMIELVGKLTGGIAKDFSSDIIRTAMLTEAKFIDPQEKVMFLFSMLHFASQGEDADLQKEIYTKAVMETVNLPSGATSSVLYSAGLAVKAIEMGLGAESFTAIITAVGALEKLQTPSDFNATFEDVKLALVRFAESVVPEDESSFLVAVKKVMLVAERLGADPLDANEMLSEIAFTCFNTGWKFVPQNIIEGLLPKLTDQEGVSEKGLKTLINVAKIFAAGGDDTKVYEMLGKGIDLIEKFGFSKTENLIMYYAYELSRLSLAKDPAPLFDRLIVLARNTGKPALAASVDEFKNRAASNFSAGAENGGDELAERDI